jgi:hypothetical protein
MARTSRITLAIPDPLLEYLREIAERRGTTVADVIRWIIAERMEGKRK